ncbi:protein of unknown function DUF456 [Syntrophobotulus glycolicus DSM 8271]|uniref:DUF456 domain-containing protein n=1 Tax=Syntrophobotulus glycolicus (strain DSM 8271 / FlGlyR) TaxID=645991 RepID=F0T1G3_SYNGF|nr:DUF456 domain-containing protein [Syntrophobotulus glycolicus]ADY56304.1 protein of unknown function DUF456 [Syntrophobotulus glycolicus DSM 8271]
MATTALIITIILFIAGLIGTILPVLPGAVLIYGGMVFYGFMTGFSTLNAYFYVLQGVVFILIFFIDYFASAVGTKRFGGSKQAAWGSVIGSIIGIITMGPLGLVIGPFAGAVIAELIRGTELKQTLRAGFGTLVGLLGGTVLKLFAEIIMIIYFFMRIS